MDFICLRNFFYISSAHLVMVSSVTNSPIFYILLPLKYCTALLALS